jgi:hypothetical protein
VRVLLLLMTGLIGMLGLCSFSRAFSVGGARFLWIRYLICFWSMILSHCCKVLRTVLWSFMVGLLGTVWKLFSERNVWTLSLKSCVYTVISPLSARVIMALLLEIIWLNCFRVCNCLLCVMFWWLVLYSCFNNNAKSGTGFVAYQGVLWHVLFLGPGSSK